jgi:hypothetical protein
MTKTGATQDPTPAEEQNILLAAIGHLCLQWALLEQCLIAIIAAAENQSLEKTYARFGSLDIHKRVNMAITVAREAKWPQRLIKPLTEIRSALQKGGGGLADRRNLFVHGVHEPTGVRGEYALTMTRWGPSKRKTVVTALDCGQLALSIIQLVQKAEGVFIGYGVWKFGPEYQTDRSEQIAKTKAAVRTVRSRQRKRAIALLIANIWPR